MQTVVEARNLTKNFGVKSVVKNIQLDIKKGECFGIIGPNGAGKTTTMRMIYCSAPATYGDLYVLGLEAKKSQSQIKEKIGVVPQENGLDPDFSVLDNLLVYSSYFNIPPKKALTKARELLRFMSLEDYEERPCDQLSGGMQRRLVIARSLISEPEILLLDEPTTGLDPQARYWIWEALTSLKKQEKTLILTTHYMEEAEKVCDRIALMDKGKILTVGAPSELIKSQIGEEVLEFQVEAGEMHQYLQNLKDHFKYQILNNKVRVFLRESRQTKEAINMVPQHNLVVRKASLDDVFLKLAGYKLDKEA